MDLDAEFAAVHESENGPSRHFAAPQQLGRFRDKADIQPDLRVVKIGAACMMA